MLYSCIGRQPLFVLTHKHDPKNDAEKFKKQLQIYGISKNNIYVFENYTKDTHTEDLETDIEFLKFLLTALEACDRNIFNLEKEKKETPKPKKVEKKESTRSSKPSQYWKMGRREKREPVYAPTVEEGILYESAPVQNQDQGSRCSLM